jgi:DNA polymerase III gamma/tau subunit
VLCTTEPQRLLDTIKGRCQGFSFLRPGVEDLRTVLRRVAAAEGIEADDEALGLVARSARGSFRDAVSTLDQLSTATGARILPDDARALLGTVEEATLLAVVDHVVARDTPAALRHLDSLAEAGQDLGQLVAELLAHLRLLFLTHQLGEPPASAPVTEETRAAIVAQAGRIDARTVLQFVDGLLAVQGELREGGDPQLPLELLLIKLTRPSADRSTEAILRRLDALEAGTPTVAAPALAARQDVVPPWEPDPEPPLGVPPTELAAAPPAAVAAPAAPAPAVVSAVIDVPEDPAELRRVWMEQVVPLVRQRKESLASLLVDGEPLRVEGGALHVGYPVAQQWRRSSADSDANRPIVAEALSQVFGVRLRVVFETLDGATGPVAAAAPVGPPAIPSPDDHEAVREHEASFLAEMREIFDAHEVTEEI